MLAGAPTRGYSIRDLLDLTYALLADGIQVDGLAGVVDDQEIRKRLDEAIMRSLVDRELWGNDADELDRLMAAPPA